MVSDLEKKRDALARAMLDISDAFRAGALAVDQLRQVIATLPNGSSISLASGEPPPGLQPENAKKPKRERKPKDPNMPKPPRPAYLQYCDANRERVRSNLPKDKSQTDVMSLLGNMWTAASDKEKAPFVAAAEKGKELFRENMRRYTEYVEKHGTSDGYKELSSLDQIQAEKGRERDDNHYHRDKDDEEDNSSSDAEVTQALKEPIKVSSHSTPRSSKKDKNANSAPNSSAKRRKDKDESEEKSSKKKTKRFEASKLNDETPSKKKKKEKSK